MTIFVQWVAQGIASHDWSSAPSEHILGFRLFATPEFLDRGSLGSRSELFASAGHDLEQTVLGPNKRRHRLRVRRLDALVRQRRDSMSLLQDTATLQKPHLLDGFDATIQGLHGSLCGLVSQVSGWREAQSLLDGSLGVLVNPRTLCHLEVVFDGQDLLRVLGGVLDFDGLPFVACLLDLGDEWPISPGCDGGDSSCSSPAGRAAHSVEVVGHVQRKFIEHNMMDIVKVQSPRCKVGADHHISRLAGEVFPDLLSPLRVHASMEGHRIDALLHHAAMDRLAGSHTVREDQSLFADYRHLGQDVPEHSLQALASGGDEDLLHLRRRGVGVGGRDRRDGHLAEVLPHEGRGRSGPSGAAEYELGRRPAVRLHTLQKLGHLLLVESVTKRVCLVDDDMLHLVKEEVLFPEVQNQSVGSADDDVDASLEKLGLLHEGVSRSAHQASEGEVSQHLDSLHRELARGLEDDGSRLLGQGIEAVAVAVQELVQDRQEVGKCLPSAGLGQHEHRDAAENLRYYNILNSRRNTNPELHDSQLNFSSERELVKRLFEVEIPSSWCWQL
mmetsp:Transcript_75872/g.158199  ORF Transcript_75872/g.158199 Transcript_75872/m.158199 type:complete len:557 (-) Transcript_75872:378-2048(-)